jgi:DNA-binding GntR family transcriptional regulator
MAQPTTDDAKLAYGQFALQDASFHAWIASHGGNELAAEALTRLYTHTHLFRLRFHTHLTEGAIREHAEIVEALSSGDPVAARDAMTSHILKSRARMAPFFESLPA